MSAANNPQAIFTCQQCGQCCRGYGGTFVSEKDIEAISHYLNINSRRFITEFCQLSGGKAVLAQGKNGYCLLWNKHKQCTIHPVKPEMCKKWPFIESLLVDPKNWQAMASTCPGIKADAPDQLIKACVKKDFPMKDEEKTQQQLIDELTELRDRIARLEAQNRRAEKNIEAYQQQLQQAQKMETLGTLVAGVAHEINNPINLIMYNLPLLQKVWSDFLPVLMAQRPKAPHQKYGGFTYDFIEDNLPQLVSDMDMAANRVAKIVSDLKNFSRQSNVAEKNELQVNTAVRNALRLAQTTLRKSGVKLDLQLTENLPLIEGNLQNIEQIILNIIINAIQSIDHNRGKVQIATGFQIKDGRIFIRIRDNGRGISPKISDKIFLPFVTDKHAVGGTGLGLSVTYSLIKAHDGEISFESREGEGTTFTIYLPTLLRRKAPRILVVDDDRQIRQMLIEALTLDRQYLVEEAVNGIEASIKLGTYRPDLLILDIFMPEMDGLEVCRIIKTEPELADMQVIITTGHPEHDKLDEVVEMGFTRIFSKPFDLWDLVKAVEGILA